MSIILGAIGKQESIAETHDLEKEITVIRKSKMNLSATVKDLMNAGSDLDPENPLVKQLEARKERLALLEKELDMKLAELQDRLEMVKADKQNYDKLFQEGVQSTYGGH